MACLLALAAVSFTGWTFRAQLFAPYGDDYAWLELALRQPGGLTATYLFTPHNGQLIVWARSIAWLGRHHGETFYFLAAGAASILVEVLALVVTVMRLSPGRTLGVALATTTALLVFDGVVVQDAAWPVFSVYVFVSSFTVLSLASFELRKRERLGSLGLWASLACAACASLGNAAGFVVWPVLVWRAVREREEQRIVLVLVGATAVALAVGFHGVTLAQSGSTHSAGVVRLVKMFRYFGGYCALPWSGGAARPAPEVAGWMLALVAAVLAAAPGRRGEGSPAVAGLGGGLIVFSLSTAIMASVGRVDELPTPIVPTRYAVFADLLHVGILLAASPWLSSAIQRRPALIQAACLLTGVLLLGQEQAMAAKIGRSADRIHAANLAFDRGNRSPVITALVFRRSVAAAAPHALWGAYGGH